MIMSNLFSYCYTVSWPVYVNWTTEADFVLHSIGVGRKVIVGGPGETEPLVRGLGDALKSPKEGRSCPFYR